jgi:transposase
MPVTPTLEDLLAEREELLKANAELRQQQRGDRSEINRLRQIIASLQHKLFGCSKGETIDTAQLQMQLSGAEEALVLLEAKEQAGKLREEETEAKATPRPGRARFVFPEQVEEVTEVLEPAEVLAEPQAYRKIGEEVTELLDIVPMKFIKKRLVRPRYVRKEDREQPPVCAPLPPRVLPGGLPAVGLLVHVLLAKYVDHLPLYRISGIFRQRYGVRLSRQTMADWVRAVAEDWLSLIYYSIKSDLLKEDFLHGDETPITCNDPDVKGRSRKGHLWVYASAEDVFYDWHMSRGLDAAASMLSGYRGRLQCDGYKVYQSLSAKEGFTLIGCMAHVRRKFYEAFDLHGEDDSAWYLVQIKALYANEREIKKQGLDPACYRNQHSRALMDAMHRHLLRDIDLLQEQNRAPRTIEAIKYALGQWEPLMRYLDDPKAQIDNNRAEQAIRPTKLGLKNWLFVGHPEAGKRSAIIYTIVENCKHHGIDPQAYLIDVLQKLPTCGSDPNAASALQPKHWKQNQASA